MNSQREELVFLRDIMSDLQRHYPEHNGEVLGEQIAVLNYRLSAIDGEKGEK